MDHAAEMKKRRERRKEFPAYEQAVRANLTKEQNDWFDNEDLHGCFDAEWSIEETVAAALEAWKEFNA